MPELLLHYIWQNRLFDVYPQYTTAGERIEVISVGKHNMDAGPDFFEAVVKIGDMVWVGNVEVHINSSDWYKHNHQTDTAYDNVILHIVKRADKDVYTTKGQVVPQCELRYPIENEKFEGFLIDRIALCNERLRKDPTLMKDGWKRFLFRERMEKKSLLINRLLSLTANDWEEAFYVTLAHNFGFHTNGIAFEMMARQTPFRCVRHLKDDLFALEALFLGQAGLLTEQEEHWQEYCYQKAKFGLQAIDAKMWKMLRLRPQNFPQVRLRQFAALWNSTESLFSTLMELHDIRQIRACFAVDSKPYKLGKSAIDSLIINDVVPYQYAYNQYLTRSQEAEKAYDLLEKIPAESNHIIDKWQLLGMDIGNAVDSQIYIHLYDFYCRENRCIHCDVGMQIFSPIAK